MANKLKYRTPLMLRAYLDEKIFPCSRTEILYYAEENNAPDLILDAIECIPEQRYWCVDEIMAQFASTLQPAAPISKSS